MAQPPLTPYQKWQKTIDAAKTDTTWNKYDSDIKKTVDAYNAHLTTKKGFTSLDWRLVKAMLWTESGGPTNPAWKSRPMQIGNSGDPGLASLLSGKEGGDVIMPPAIEQGLTSQNAASTPQRNIEAGVGYLLLRAAKFKFESVEDAADTVHTYVVKPGQSFSAIADKTDSTIHELEILNPGKKILHAGDKINIKKAKVTRVVDGFQSVDTAFAAKYYNTKDTSYQKKLDYCLSIIGKK